MIHNTLKGGKAKYSENTDKCKTNRKIFDLKVTSFLNFIQGQIYQRGVDSGNICSKRLLDCIKKNFTKFLTAFRLL